MQTYTTQMDAARKGIITPQMEIVAKKEYRTPEEIRQLVAEGKVAIPANKHHECLDPEGIGSMLRTKINVNLGVSRDCKDYNIEMQKVMSAVNMGAEAIMDLSSHGNTQPFRQKLTHECPVMIGTVPVYDSVIHYQRDLAELTAQDFIDVVRLHAEDGVDFVTLHCGITRKTIEQIRKHKRKMNIVSRGGSLVFAWMSMTGNENPFYEHFDEICEICAEHDVTISLGDACRPGCLADATDVCQIEELVRLGELTKRAWAHNVQVMVEGPGHVPLNQVAANMEVQKSICMGAPFYVLGPLVTDIAPGYDHITAAIGGAVAAASGAAFLCYVTPAEHLALPNVDDVKQGIVASKIAAHAADIANAHEFIINQPDGYDSILGERGVGLSGGEKQRISIARAVLMNPSILVFDEATAAVDSETENQIQTAIERLISGRTTLMIAHRLSTLRKANKIIVVDNGKIIKCGSHDELMALKGKFYRLIKIQSMSEEVEKTKAAEKFE